MRENRNAAGYADDLDNLVAERFGAASVAPRVPSWPALRLWLVVIRSYCPLE